MITDNMRPSCLGTMLCFAFAAELGYASDPAAESDITQRLRAPPFDFSRSAAACANLSNIQTCLGQNGCAWCKGAAEIADACRRWEECTGPGQLCELRKNETFCAAKLSRAEQTGKGACTWCPSEQRCVPAFSVPGQQSQQCRGCDGKFDSAALVDLCGTCGGECHDERIQHIDNKHLRCPCAGCDGIPNSGVAFDTCGVCGGNNRSCVSALSLLCSSASLPSFPPHPPLSLPVPYVLLILTLLLHLPSRSLAAIPFPRSLLLSSSGSQTKRRLESGSRSAGTSSSGSIRPIIAPDLSAKTVTHTGYKSTSVPVCGPHIACEAFSARCAPTLVCTDTVAHARDMNN